jgi:hypothetical protein
MIDVMIHLKESWYEVIKNYVDTYSPTIGVEGWIISHIADDVNVLLEEEEENLKNIFEEEWRKLNRLKKKEIIKILRESK